ncbi:MAG: 30S ribosomal protein S12 methylthiotransferase RimO [Bacteroidaceae bacterium]|nr:30S ribosomal protein S12 methylthiotransferase RimO [Bacteroidaceae bacterium]
MNSSTAKHTAPSLIGRAGGESAIDILTLGCSKNLVDSERLMAQLRRAGYVVRHDPEVCEGDICIINTCGFIGDAKEESINVILEQGQRKEEGSLRKLFVMGCLSQRYLAELQTEIPEVDGWYGKFDWSRILADLGHAWDDALTPGRAITTPSHYAYIKISEGCNRHCSYCAIPIITGHHVSRPMEEILEEVRQLVAVGVKEFNVIAQELTFYGVDLYHRRAIAELIDRMADIEGVEWIRLHYAYPADFPWELLPVINRHPNICRYLDIALQHIADPVLTAMRRHITKEETYAFVERIRREVPGIHLRTTLMVGHPGETEEGFQELLEFTRWARFERMGAFAYSEEEGTHSAEAFTDDIPEEVKQVRLSKLMRLQQRISGDIQEAKVGTVQRVVIDRREGDYFVGRTQYDSPEVDPEVLVAVADLAAAGITDPVGQFLNLRITSADDFDLYAKPETDNTSLTNE